MITFVVIFLPLLTGVLSRLDDPSSEVRDYAIQALTLLKPKFIQDYDKDTWELIFCCCNYTEAIIQIGRDHPHVLRPLLTGLPKSFGHSDELEIIKSSVFID